MTILACHSNRIVVMDSRVRTDKEEGLDNFKVAMLTLKSLGQGFIISIDYGFIVGISNESSDK